MAIFRLSNNVPDVYVRKSRDFQLLCNSFDVLQNGVKYDIDSICNIVNTEACNSKVIPLLQTKLGFFTPRHIDNETLRTVLSGFKNIVRDKGSRVGIRDAIEVYLKTINASADSLIKISNTYIGPEGEDLTQRKNTYVVEVAIEGQVLDTTLLTELLKYVLPAGYQLKYSFYAAYEQVTPINQSDTIEIIFVRTYDANGVRAYKDTYTESSQTNNEWKLTGLVDISQAYMSYVIFTTKEFSLLHDVEYTITWTSSGDINVLFYNNSDDSVTYTFDPETNVYRFDSDVSKIILLHSEDPNKGPITEENNVQVNAFSYSYTEFAEDEEGDESPVEKTVNFLTEYNIESHYAETTADKIVFKPYLNTGEETLVNVGGVSTTRIFDDAVPDNREEAMKFLTKLEPIVLFGTGDEQQ